MKQSKTKSGGVLATSIEALARAKGWIKDTVENEISVRGSRRANRASRPIRSTRGVNYGEVAGYSISTTGSNTLSSQQAQGGGEV